MKKSIFLLILIYAVSNIFAQTFDEKKAWVKEKYLEIENNLDNYSEKEYIEQPDQNYPPSAYYYFWFNSKNEIVKAEMSMGEEGYSSEASYYFYNNKLFFVYNEDCEPNWETDKFSQDCHQSRTYLYNEEVFDCLIKSENTLNDTYIPNKKSTRDFKEITKISLEQANDILELSEESE